MGALTGHVISTAPMLLVGTNRFLSAYAVRNDMGFLRGWGPGVPPGLGGRGRPPLHFHIACIMQVMFAKVGGYAAEAEVETSLRLSG